MRVSTDKQSTDSQRLELERFCAARGWDPTFYQDQISGTKTSRAGLDALMSDVRRGRVVRVLVYKLDRLGRSLSHLALILAELHGHNVALVASSQGIDTSSDNPAGRFQVHVLMAVAEFERNLIRERVLAGMAAAKANGRRFGRPKISQDLVDQVLACRKAGQGIREISRNTGVSTASVARICKP